jgi:glyoxylase-like metal-dependent hydrolase (beta-lactamase superfamily II)
MLAMQDALPVELPDLDLHASQVRELEPGVWHVPVPLPFGVHAVNVYLLRGPQGWLLVDAPLRTALAEGVLRTALARVGIAPTEISAIVLTHVHPDHLGGVGFWQRLSGAPVYLHPQELPQLDRLWGDLGNEAFLDAARALVAHGMPADQAQALVTRAVELRSLLELPTDPATVEHGQRVALAGDAYTVQWTPGHADGHIALLRDDGLLIAGDVGLHGLRPTVGWYPWSRPDPLADQLASLAALSTLDVRLTLPGHGEPFSDLSQRAASLYGGYLHELVTLSRMLADAPTGLSAYAIAHVVSSVRWRLVDSRLVAMAEAVARLEHLHAIGRAEKYTAADGTITYHRADESAPAKIRETA